MTSFAVRNFGCRVNQAEAFEWAAVLQERGWTLVREPRDAGLILVNSCTLTARADRDVRKFLRRAGRECPEARIVVTGCLAERAPEEMAALPGVWRVLSNRDKARLPEAVARAGEISPAAAQASRFRARAFLKVQDGCAMSCAFCVIPTVRGPSVSVPPALAAEKARALAGQGYPEIVLTGIHLSSYGGDLVPPASLLDLLRLLESGPGRFRLSSLDPRFTPPPLIEHLASSRSIRPHFHLSLQHASAPVLRAMGRNSAAEEYESLLSELSRRVPEAALGADMLVGFPGETEGDFDALVRFVERSPLSYVHVFAYSPRPGTAAGAAAEGGKAVSEAVKAGRAACLRSLARHKELAFRRRFLGRDLEAMVIRTRAGGSETLTENGIEAFVPDPSLVRGRTVRIRITGAGESLVTAEVRD